MSFDDYETNYDFPCPHCGHHETRSRDCDRCGGEGFIDGYEEDPVWYDEDDLINCDECRATGSVMWCPECGEDPRVKPKEKVS